MTDHFTEITEFLKRRSPDLSDDGTPEREILDALIARNEAGRPPPRISITYHSDGPATRRNNAKTGLEIVEPRTRRHITPEEIEKGLGAERVTSRNPRAKSQPRQHHPSDPQALSSASSVR